MRPKRDKDLICESSTLDAESVQRYAKKVARQAALTSFPYFRGSTTDLICLLAAAPAEAARNILLGGNEQYTTLDQEGVLIGLRTDGTLVSDTYSYGASWPASEAKRFDESKIQRLNGTSFSFAPFPVYMLTYLDVGRDRWREVAVPKYGSTIKREELNDQRYPIVHAKGVGMSRALRGLFVKASGTPPPPHSR